MSTLWRIGLGLGLIVGGLGMQLAIVAGFIGPGLWRSLAGHAALFAGMMCIVTAVLKHSRRVFPPGR